MKSKLQCPQLKSDWLTATLTCLHTVCGCSCGKTAELSGSNRGPGPAKPKVLTFWPLTEKVGRSLFQTKEIKAQ